MRELRSTGERGRSTAAGRGRSTVAGRARSTVAAGQARQIWRRPGRRGGRRGPELPRGFQPRAQEHRSIVDGREQRSTGERERSTVAGQGRSIAGVCSTVAERPGSTWAARRVASILRCPTGGCKIRRLAGWGCSGPPGRALRGVRRAPAPPRVCRGCCGRLARGRCWRAGQPSLRWLAHRRPAPSMLLQSASKRKGTISESVTNSTLTTECVEWLN